MKVKRHNFMEGPAEPIVERFGDIGLCQYGMKPFFTILTISSITFPELSQEIIKTVPKTEGVCHLLDENNNSVIAIVGTGNLLECVGVKLETERATDILFREKCYVHTASENPFSSFFWQYGQMPLR